RLVEGRLSAQARFIEVPHHLAHGASAFFASSFDRAAVISVDNKGDMISAALMTGNKGELHIDAEAQFPHSIGMVYSAVTAALGFDGSGDWHKTMWLAPTGTNTLEDLFSELLSIDNSGLPVVNLSYFEPPSSGTASLSSNFFERAALTPRQKDKRITQQHRNLAASVQARVEDALCEIGIRHRERTGEENLCVAGGVALNSLAMSAVERRAGFARLFVQPAAGNAGCSIGAALYVWHQVL